MGYLRRRSTPRSARTPLRPCAGSATGSLGVQRQIDRHDRPAVGAVVDNDPAVMGGHDLGDDRQPQPAATRGAGAVGVQAHEPLEDPLAILHRNPRPVIGDRHAPRTVLNPHRYLDGRTGMPHSVVHEIAETRPNADRSPITRVGDRSARTAGTPSRSTRATSCAARSSGSTSSRRSTIPRSSERASNNRSSINAHPLRLGQHHVARQLRLRQVPGGPTPPPPPR